MTQIVLTQPLPRSERLARRLRDRGHQVAQLPARRLVSLTDDPQIRSELGRLAHYDWVLFVSPGAIAITLDALRTLGLDWPAATGVGLIGPGSEQELAEHRFPLGQVRIVRPNAAPFDADALLGHPPFDAPAGLKLLVIAGASGRTDWLQTLRDRGASVQRLVVYRSEPIEPLADQLARLSQWAQQPGSVVFVFTIADAVSVFETALASCGITAWAHGQPALAPHPRIVQALRSTGWSQTRLVDPGEPALVAAIESC